MPWARDRKEPFTELFVGGVRRPRARTPNAGDYFYSRRLHLTDAAKHPQCLGLSYSAGDLGPWANQSDAVIVLFHNCALLTAHNTIDNNFIHDSRESHTGRFHGHAAGGRLRGLRHRLPAR